MNIKYYLFHPKALMSALFRRFGGFIPDKIYLQWQYYLKMGHRLNLKNPILFTEKIQWLKLYDRKPEYTDLVDKAKAKQIVGEKIGFEHIIPTIGEWERVEDIDWDSLPNQFVLKTTHGGGGCGVVICKDKSNFDKEPAKKKLAESLKSDIYKNYREWPYKNVPRKIIAEEYLSHTPSKEIPDYKFFCFEGEPKFLKVDFGRFSEHHANYYDLEWNLLKYIETAYPPDPNHLEKAPKNYDEMLNIVRTLCKDFQFIRIDLYNNGKIYFGELTFYPSSGFTPWGNIETDYEIGNYLRLPESFV